MGRCPRRTPAEHPETSSTSSVSPVRAHSSITASDIEDLISASEASWRARTPGSSRCRTIALTDEPTHHQRFTPAPGARQVMGDFLERIGGVDGLRDPNEILECDGETLWSRFSVAARQRNSGGEQLVAGGDLPVVKLIRKLDCLAKPPVGAFDVADSKKSSANYE